ncbi:uncharacterized protein isoform X2 [Leptinotarsa decemlineata]|uniref:uncharacterized protein isoform X2 n=1 Tax=Leptinotarsa decemlineata TaxID=7539 RepID=UPI000C254AF9|nr:uncharacterized protein LOC111508838 isoform X2 [Leptinotarsa decemlineata]
MLFYLISILTFSILCRSDIEIKDAGIVPVSEDLTIGSKCDKDLEISVHMEECCEQSKENQNDCKMLLIGGHMGILYKKYTKNVTLIYPNLYLLYRQGTCTVAVKYRSEKYEKVLTKVIEFKTNATTEDRNICPTVDTDPLQECRPQDCVIKYSGERSYFNPSTKECECAPLCLNDLQMKVPDIAYSCTNNVCMNLNTSITKFDLEYLENNQIDAGDIDALGMINVVCHHGDLDSGGECQCQNDWKTTLDDDDIYEPSLMLYHMCNVETGGWNCVNRSKIKTTALIIAIFAVTIASKILILMCLLNWCYKQFKVPKEIKACIDGMDPSDKTLLVSENIDSVEKCICQEMKKNRFPTLLKETVNVSFYPCNPSIKSSDNNSVTSEKSKTKTLTPTTTSSMPISFESGTEDTTADSDESDEEDYEIEFSGGEEYYGEEFPKGKISAEQTDFTESVEEESKGRLNNSSGSKPSTGRSKVSNKTVG